MVARIQCRLATGYIFPITIRPTAGPFAGGAIHVDVRNSIYRLNISFLDGQ